MLAAESFVSKVEEYTDKDYLHSDFKHSGLNKQKIDYQKVSIMLQSHTKKMLKTMSEYSDGSVTEQQIRDTLNLFSSGGKIGDRIVQLLQANNVFKNNANDPNVMRTSSNVFSDFKGTLSKISDRKDHLDNIINDMIRVYAKAEKGAAIYLIRIYYGRRKKLDQDLMEQLVGKVPKNYVVTKKDMESAGRLAQAMKTLRELINSKNIDESSLKEKIEAEFNILGGDMAEAAVKWATEVAAKEYLEEEAKEMMKLNSDICTVRLTGEDLAEDDIKKGSQAKNDITVNFSRDNLSFLFGGNIKTRNSESFWTNKNSKWLTGLRARGSTLDTGLRELERQDIISYKYGMAIFGSKKKEEDWNEIRRMIAISQITDALVGLAMQETDLSGILIVNNDILSIPALLDKIAKNLTTKGVRSNGVSFEGGTKPEYEDKTYDKGESDTVNKLISATYRNETAYEQITKKKISIKLNVAAFI